MYGGPQIAENVRCELRPTVIDAPGLLGDSSSIKVLERFSGKTPNPMLRQSAKNAAEQIRERLQYGPDQMLRASAAPDRPDQMLRAVCADHSRYDDPQALLRADTERSAQSGDPQQFLRADSAEARLQHSSAPE